MGEDFLRDEASTATVSKMRAEGPVYENKVDGKLEIQITHVSRRFPGAEWLINK